MGLLDRIFGDAPRQPAPSPSSDDEHAIARYRYMLKTAPPEAIEQAHAEAFARLAPEQRRKVLEGLRAATPATERASEPVLSDPQALARYATRAEIRQPGTLERTFGGLPGGAGMGGLFAGSLLASMAGTVLGTAIAQQFMGQHGAADFGAPEHPHTLDGLHDGGSIVDAVDDGGGADLDMGDTFDV